MATWVLQLCYSAWDDLLTNDASAQSGSYKLSDVSFVWERFDNLRRQQHFRQLLTSRCLSGCIFRSQMRQRRVGRDLVLLQCQRRPGGAQGQHRRNGGNMTTQHTQDSTKRDESFHTEMHEGKQSSSDKTNQYYKAETRTSTRVPYSIRWGVSHLSPPFKSQLVNHPLKCTMLMYVHMLPRLEFIVFSSVQPTLLVFVLACGLVQKPSSTACFSLIIIKKNSRKKNIYNSIIIWIKVHIIFIRQFLLIRCINLDNHFLSLIVSSLVDACSRFDPQYRRGKRLQAESYGETVIPIILQISGIASWGHRAILELFLRGNVDICQTVFGMRFCWCDVVVHLCPCDLVMRPCLAPSARHLYGNNCISTRVSLSPTNACELFHPWSAVLEHLLENTETFLQPYKTCCSKKGDTMECRVLACSMRICAAGLDVCSKATVRDER